MISPMAKPMHRYLCLMKHPVGEDSGSRKALRRGQGRVDEESSWRFARHVLGAARNGLTAVRIPFRGRQARLYFFQGVDLLRCANRCDNGGTIRRPREPFLPCGRSGFTARCNSTRLVLCFGFFVSPPLEYLLRISDIISM